MILLKNSRRRKVSTVLCTGKLKIGHLFWQKEEERRQNSSNQFLYLRAIQRHSGGIAIDPGFQDNVLLPEGFTEYIYHVGNVSEMHSIIRNGLIPGGQESQMRKTICVIHLLNAMEDDNCMEETPWDLTKPKIVSHKNTWKPQKYCIFVQFETRTRRL